MISLLPAMSSCVELVPVAPPAAAFSTLSIVLSCAWYFAGTTTLAAIPLVVEEVSEGVQEVVRGAVIGSLEVVRCISYGIIMIAALALVRIGNHILATLNRHFGGWNAKRDSFVERYGGRFKGGGSRELAVVDLPRRQVTVEELHGNGTELL